MYKVPAYIKGVPEGFIQAKKSLFGAIFCSFLAYVKKKQYLCTRFRNDNY